MRQSVRKNKKSELSHLHSYSSTDSAKSTPTRCFFQQRENKVSLFLFSEIFCCFVAVGVDFVESVEEGP